MPQKRKPIAISNDDVRFIFNENDDELNLCLSSCWCANCKTGRSIIVDYSAELNALYDVVLRGFCLQCKGPVSRYIETGDNPRTKKNAEAVWHTHHTLKELKIKKQP